jgi:hypothetical protein
VILKKKKKKTVCDRKMLIIDVLKSPSQRKKKIQFFSEMPSLPRREKEKHQSCYMQRLYIVS